MSETATPSESRNYTQEVSRVLPQEQVGYFQAVHDKHFVPETAIGSLFTDARNLHELLQIAAGQRGGLDGDDREEFIRRGVPAGALMPQCRYLMVHTPGEVGITRVSDLPPDTEVQVIRTKPQTPCSLVVEREKLPSVDFGTIIIGPNEKEQPKDPDPSTEEMVWTAHPGLPVRPATEDIWEEGASVTAEEVIAQLGDGVYLNVKKKTPAVSP